MAEAFYKNRYYRFITDPACPGPRHIHIFGDFSHQEEFQKFLETNEVDAVIVDDTSLFKPRPHNHRCDLRYGSWLQLLRRCGSGDFNLSLIQRYLFEVMLISQELANLMRDRPLFLGEHVFEAFEASNEYKWSQKFCNKELQKAPVLERVHTSKVIFAEQIRALLKAKEGKPSPTPTSNELKEYMVQIKDGDSDFEYDDEMFGLTVDSRDYMYTDVGPKSRGIFLNRWGKAYVHNVYKKATSGNYQTIAIVTNQDQYLDEIVNLWGKTSDYDVKELLQAEKRLSPRYKLGYGLMAFCGGHFLLSSRGTPGMQKMALLASMGFLAGTLMSGTYLNKLMKLDKVVVKRGEEYHNFMSSRETAAAT